MYFILNRITTNTVTLVSSSRSIFINEFGKEKLNKNTNFNKMFSLNTAQDNFNLEKSKLPIVSKTLSQTRKDMSNIGILHNKTPHILTNYFSIYDLKLKAKTNHINKLCFNSISSSESNYSGNVNNKVHNITLTLNNLVNFYKIRNYPSIYNFNIKNNLGIASQQRWLTRNSLLTESIVSNSFLFTQVKKLIGTGSLNSNFTNQSL
jgi:hypothetical protein